MAADAINSEVQPVSRKKTRQQAIGEELQEGFSHLGTAIAEAGRLAAEQLGPRVEAAQKAAGPTLEAAQKAVEARLATTVAPRVAAATPKVAAAMAAAAPTVVQAREAIAPRVEAARDAAGPALERAREAVEHLALRVEAAREAAAPRVGAAVAAAQAAATRAAADLAPRVEHAREVAQKTLADDVAPRVAAAVAAATPVLESALENARENLAAGVDTALGELEARRKELAANTAKARKKAKKRATKQRKQLEKKATSVKRRVGAEPPPRRWPWALAALAVVAGAIAVALRRKKDDDLWGPTPAGDGPVPSYREDPVPSSPSNTPGRTVSSAGTAPSDATPPDSDLGMQAPQPAPGRSEAADRPSTPGTATSGATDGALSAPTAGPDQPVPEGPGGVDPRSDATNDTDAATGPAGTPLADRGEAPRSPNPQDPA